LRSVPSVSIYDKLKKMREAQPAQVGATRPKAGRDVDLTQVLDGEYRQTPYGACFVAEKWFEPDHWHGNIPLSQTFSLDPETISAVARDRSLAQLDLRKAAFIDTETTGLQGGTGTQAFLVGVGRILDQEIVVRQHFMPSPAQERALLESLNQDLAGCESVVSYNGKAFDMPLLRDRYVMARTEMPLQEPPHFDLLFPTRRLFAQRLGGAALQLVEQKVLGIEREIDIPSYMIPEVYFDLLRYGRTERLVPVFEHNLNDILSLMTLAVKLQGAWSNPLEGGLDDPTDMFCLARSLENDGRLELASRCYSTALDWGIDAGLERACLWRLSMCLKRMDKRDEAAQIWEGMCRSPFGSGRPFIEMAKFLEHHRKDYARAAAVASSGLIASKQRAMLEKRSAEGSRETADLRHRLARLKRRMQTQESGQQPPADV
jgi:uncharacterized protein YprB with RNaseH-like and TPR domain